MVPIFFSCSSSQRLKSFFFFLFPSSKTMIHAKTRVEKKMRADWTEGVFSSRSPAPPSLEKIHKYRGVTCFKRHSKRPRQQELCRGGKDKQKRESKNRAWADCGLTAWAASEDQLTDFVVDEDEQGVWEGAEPPVGPWKQTQRARRRLEKPNLGQHVLTAFFYSLSVHVTIMSNVTIKHAIVIFIVTLIQMWVLFLPQTYLRGYILRATSMPGQ